MKTSTNSALNSEAGDSEACLTMSVEASAKLLGIGRNQAYEAVKRGEIPTIKIGRRKLVSVPALMRKINEAS